MEPRREEEQQPSAQPKPKRFRIVKLEERIAPSKGGNGTHKTYACGTLNVYTCPTYGDTCYCTAFCTGPGYC